MWSDMYIGLHVKYLLFLSGFNESWIFLTNFQKMLKYEIPWKSIQWLLDGYDVGNRYFPQFCEHALKKYRTIILYVVLYGCETLFLILRAGHRLSTFQHRVLRKIFGSQREKVTGDWGRLSWDSCSVLLTKYSLGDHIRKNEMGRVCGRYGERRGAYKIDVGT